MPTCEPFKKAQVHCLMKHSTLPIIKSKAQSIFLQERINNKSVWLDLQRVNSTHWEWTDGSYLTEFKNWYPRQPRNVVRQNYDCVVKKNRDIRTGWELEDCEACRTTICQKGKYNQIKDNTHPNNKNQKSFTLRMYCEVIQLERDRLFRVI